MIEESGLPGRWGPCHKHSIFVSRDPEFSRGRARGGMGNTTTQPDHRCCCGCAKLAVSSRDEAVRVRAAQVVGRLAVRDFGHVCHRVLIEWSDSVNSKARESGRPQRLKLSRSACRHRYGNLLEEWCKDGNHNRQRTCGPCPGHGDQRARPSRDARPAPATRAKEHRTASLRPSVKPCVTV